MKLERIFACGCALVGWTFLLEPLRPVVPSWMLIVLLSSGPVVTGAVFAHLGTWRNRDAFASGFVAIAMFVVFTLLIPSARSRSFGKLVVGAVILAVGVGVVIMLGSWLARRLLDGSAGVVTLVVISTLLTTCLVNFGIMMVRGHLTTSTTILVIFETGFALLAGIATQRITPIRHIIACGSGSIVMMVCVVAEKYVLDHAIDLTVSWISDVLAIAGGFAGAAIGAKLRYEPPPSYSEFD